MAIRLSVDATAASWQAIAALFQAVAEVTRCQPVYAVVTVPEPLVAEACRLVRAIDCEAEISASATDECGRLICDCHIDLACVAIGSADELRHIMELTKAPREE